MMSLKYENFTFSWAAAAAEKKRFNSVNAKVS